MDSQMIESVVEKMERRARQSTPVRTEKTGMPWLVIPCGEGLENQTFCTIDTKGTSNVELKSIPELRNHEMWACYHGWLLLSTSDYHLWSLWNPITYGSIKLPPLDLELIDVREICFCIFTTSPKNYGCTVMIFDDSSTTMLYCQPGDQHWTQYDYGTYLLEFEGEKYKLDTFRHMACVDGVIYANASYKHMVAIEFDNQTRQIKLKILASEFSRTIMFTERCYEYYVESFGELYAIYMLCHHDIEEISGIEVFKWDFSRKVWVEVENLDGRLIFLGCNENCTSCLTDTNIRGNKIYFMKWQDKHLYVYDLEEGTILNLLPCPSLQTPRYKPFWLTPEYARANAHVNMKPGYNICPVLEQQTKVAVEIEVQSPRDMEISDDQYPPNIFLDILTEVAKNLEPLAYLEYRATCRMFRSAAPAIQRSITSIINELESPWLVTFRHNKSHFSFTDPKYNNNYFMKVPESLQGTVISGSKDGYLLMVKGMNVICFNPFTRMQVKLPTASTKDNRLSLSSSPSSSDCLAVKIHIFVVPEVESLCLGDDDWDIEEFEGYEYSFNAKEPGVFHEGKFYFLGEKGSLGVLKIEDGFSWEIIVKDAPTITFYHAYLMKCNGDLMVVFVGRCGNWVKVYNLQCTPSEDAPSKKIWKWERVRNLGSYTLFISNISSIAAIARSPGMENKVYFSRFYGRHIVYYSLQTKKFHTHGSNVVLDNLVDTKEQLYSTWIHPGLEIS